MADPLGLIGASGGSGQIGGPRGPHGPGQSPGQPGGAADPSAPSFKDVLTQNLDKVNQLQAEASSATEDLMTGKRTDLEGVLLATQKADTAFRMLLALRNKVQAAYEEVKQIRV